MKINVIIPIFEILFFDREYKMKLQKLAAILVVLGVSMAFKQTNVSVKQLSLRFTSKILENKKYITISGEVYFKKETGLLTTHLTKPFENVTIVNADGDMKNYDFQDNTVMLSSSALTSSESSYFWYFLNGNYSDLGLQKTGFVIQNTRIEDKMLITNWVPKAGSVNPIARVEIVHEKNLPVYLGFIGAKEKPLGKIFFSSYQKIGNLNIPLKITEIAYTSKTDSTLVAKTYFDPKLNSDVDLNYLNFKIPSNAKVVSKK